MQASLDLSRLRRGGLRRWPGPDFQTPGVSSCGSGSAERSRYTVVSPDQRVPSIWGRQQPHQRVSHPARELTH